MLMPDYFTDGKEEKILELYRRLEEWILKDIANRLIIAGEMSGTTDWLLYKLRVMGESQQAIMKKLMRLTGLSNKELKALLQDAVMTSWDYDKSIFDSIGGIQILNPMINPNVVKVMNAEYKKVQGEIHNLTRTTMQQYPKDLMNMLNEIEIRVSSGVQSYSSAVCEILDKYAGKGYEVSYPTGAKRTLEAAVRMCVVTSMNQTAAQVTNQYIIEGKAEYVLVSAHYGARTAQKGQQLLADHNAWQGKAYKINGSEPGYPNLLESTGYDIDLETGNGKVVNPLGLHGYNCRHSHQPWYKDLKNPWVDENGNLVIDTKKSKEIYEKQQKQRAMERAIRKTKRELIMKEEQIKLIAETDVKDILQKDYDKLAYKLRQQNKKYNAYCETNNLQKQSDRIKSAGFKKKQAFKANAAATKYKNSQDNNVEKGISGKANNTTEKNKVNIDYINSKKYREKFYKITNNPDVNAELYKCAKAELIHRNGTYKEDMYLISIIDGKRKGINTSTKLDNIIEYNDSLNNAILSNPKGTLISIHNHGTNLPPTGADFSSAGVRQYAQGVIVCHNGDVYTYKVGSKIFTSKLFDDTVEKYKKLMYNEFDAHIKALEQFERDYDIEWRKL